MEDVPASYPRPRTLDTAEPPSPTASACARDMPQPTSLIPFRRKRINHERGNTSPRKPSTALDPYMYKLLEMIGDRSYHVVEQHVGIYRGALSRWSRGISIPNAMTLNAVGKVFGYELVWRKIDGGS